MEGGISIFKLRKILALVFVFSTLMCMYTQTAYACTKNPNCNSTNVTVQCGAVSEYYVGTHNVTYPNGYVITCTITAIAGDHIYTCSGCGSYLGSGYRQCAELHTDSYCHDSYNLCK